MPLCIGMPEGTEMPIVRDEQFLYLIVISYIRGHSSPIVGEDSLYNIKETENNYDGNATAFIRNNLIK